MPLRWAAVVILFAGCATTRGHVFIDRNCNGLRDAGEPGVAGIVVGVDRAGFTRTGGTGEFRFDGATAGEIVWARVPDGFRPGSVWAAAAPDGDVELGLVPANATGPATFVVAADTHTTDDPADPWDGGDLADAIDQATNLETPPRFFTIVGDLTQGGKPGELARVAEALATSDVPFVSVPGNHDWLDGGAAYRRAFGPDNYSFDVANLHVVVWDTNLTDDEQIAFVTADLAQGSGGRIVVALGHASPSDAVADAFAELGVAYIFDGHWHANRRADRNGLVEWGTQTFIMGGIDQSPAGYRIVTFDGDDPTIIDRERLVAPHLDAVAPNANSCSEPGPLDVIAAVALDGNAAQVTARVDCGAPIALTAAGGWDVRGDGPALAAGTHTLELSATTASGRRATRDLSFEVCARAAAPTAADAWSQLGGDAAHAGSRDAPTTPPLQVAWTSTIGAQLAHGSPVVAGDLAIVAVTDRAAGDRGGLVAVELATGRERWRVRTEFPVTAAPAIDGDTVIATRSDGTLIAYALADGSERWRYALAAHLANNAATLWAPPAIADHVVYAGVPGRFAAVDVATGVAVWSVDRTPPDPWLGSLAAAAIANDTVLAAFDRDSGLVARSVADGSLRWQLGGRAGTAINATPVIAGDTAYVCNAYGDVTAISVATGAIRWTRTLTPKGFDWGYSITAAPAYSHGRLFVPTQWNDLVALDATTGAELWRVATPGGPLETAHYRSAQPGFAASPLVTGGIVWIGRPDGALVALDAATGAARGSIELGAPILSAPVPAGDALLVMTYDGTLHALVPAAPISPASASPCPPLPPSAPYAASVPAAGCCDAGSHDAPPFAVLFGWLALRRRSKYRRCVSAFAVRGPRRLVGASRQVRETAGAVDGIAVATDRGA